MNLILLFPEDYTQEGQVRLSGRRMAHVLDVHRARVGDELCVGLIGGEIGRGRIVALDAERLEMEVQLGQQPPASLPLTLLLALPRPLVLKRVLISAASMGVKRILLINAQRVEKSFWQSTALKGDAIAQQLILGLEQARDTQLPEVTLRPRFRPFVEDELPGIAQDGRAFVAHPGAALPCPRAVDGRVVLAIGPEGGWTTYELEKLTAAGLVPITLGERILRVESIVPALLSRLF